MPAPIGTTQSDEEALAEVVRSLNHLEQVTGANPHDIDFLHAFLNDQSVASLVHAQETLEMEQPPPPMTNNADGLLQETLEDARAIQGHNFAADELVAILENHYLKELLRVHDTIANQDFAASPDLNSSAFEPEQGSVFVYDPPDPVYGRGLEERVVSVRKMPNEPLGLTVQEDFDSAAPRLVVTRIMFDGATYRAGLLHVGDIITEVNGTRVYTPEDIVDIIREVTGSVSFKIIPGHRDSAPVQPMYVKAHFTYNPDKDSILPCREAGLPFNEGEVLEVLNRDDDNWWQARHVGGENNPTGLVPSQSLEQRRQAFVKPDYDMTSSSFCGLSIKKKKKVIFDSKKNTEFDKNDLLVYEEMAKLPPFERKTLVLVGPSGVGRRSLKNKFIEHDHQRFGTAVPHTSRPKRPEDINGVGYWYEDAEKMKRDINNGEYLEYGQFEGHYYGTRIDSISSVIHEGTGKMCIIDCNPEGAKLLKQLSKLMPLVVFISSPPIETLKSMYEESRQIGRDIQPRTERDMRRTVQESARIEEQYKQYFDFHLINDNFDLTFKRLLDAMENLATEEQWVPVSWVY